MIKHQLKVVDEMGIHARPASTIVSKAMPFESEMVLRFGDKQANLKSIMQILSLGIGPEEIVEISILGPDEVEASSTLIEALTESQLFELF